MYEFTDRRIGLMKIFKTYFSLIYVFCTNLVFNFDLKPKLVTQRIIGRQILSKVNTSRICLVFFKAVRNRIEIN